MILGTNVRENPLQTEWLWFLWTHTCNLWISFNVPELILTQTSSTFEPNTNCSLETMFLYFYISWLSYYWKYLFIVSMLLITNSFYCPLLCCVQTFSFSFVNLLRSFLHRVFQSHFGSLILCCCGRRSKDQNVFWSFRDKHYRPLESNGCEITPTTSLRLHWHCVCVCVRSRFISGVLKDYQEVDLTHRNRAYQPHTSFCEGKLKSSALRESEDILSDPLRSVHRLPSGFRNIWIQIRGRDGASWAEKWSQRIRAFKLYSF